VAQLDAAVHCCRGYGRRLRAGGGAAYSDDRSATGGQADHRGGTQRGCAGCFTRGLTSGGQTGSFAFGGGCGVGRTVAQRGRCGSSRRCDVLEGRVPG